MYIDTHCHLSKEDYSDINSIIENNKNENVEIIVISGCSKDSIKETITYINHYPQVYATLGYHPMEVDNVTLNDLSFLEEKLQLLKVVGVGEIGLDYHYDKSKKQEQIDLFEKQLQIAEKLNLPVVIHSRDATKDTIDILKKYYVKGVIHCFSGSYETAQNYIKMGFYLGIGGIVTFKNSNLPSVIKKVPLEKILLETDSPYLTPEPYRCKQNSSKYIPLIAAKIANIKEISEDIVEKTTTKNAFDLFDFSFFK